MPSRNRPTLLISDDPLSLHALYASKLARRVWRVVPENLATVEPPCPSNTAKRAGPLSSRPSFVTVEPTGCSGMPSAGGALDPPGGRKRCTECESSMPASQVNANYHGLTYPPTLHIGQANPVLLVAQHHRRVLLGNCSCIAGCRKEEIKSHRKR